MFFYKFKDKYLFSLKDEYSYKRVSESEALDISHELYFLTKINKEASKKTFAVAHTSDLYIEEENLELLKLCEERNVPDGIRDLINQRKIKAVNTEYNYYEDSIYFEVNKRKTVHILALGDVGSTLLTGLKLLGGSCIEAIGIYDRSQDKVNRWEYEMNQTSWPNEYDALPEVYGINKDELFECDMFIFCASKGVPPVGAEVSDVRMVQFEQNAVLIGEYAKIAADKGFKGIFAVVSDPVDLLCKTVLKKSRGILAPEQIKGYGLGVMNARAAYYAKKHREFSQFLTEGRAFGPHGNDLVIADSINSYNNDLSVKLTELAVKANIEVRKTGFKPFVAPALSSGAISIICTLEGKWHYSSNYIGGVYMGAKNRNIPAGLEIEKIAMPEQLFERLKKTYERLRAMGEQ